jgi:hypothetical protein
MNSNRTLVRWGALALLVTLMSGCCIAPWGGRYYGGGHDPRGGYGYGYGGGGHEHGGDHGGGDHGGGWHH